MPLNILQKEITEPQTIAHKNVKPTGIERFFPETDIIVSKTDTKGRITYANEVFLKIASMHKDEVIGAPHNIIRHPEMPRCVFKLLWDRISSGNEVFAYVLNLASNGDHYWVFAHVTPTYDNNDKIIGYHSSRRSPVRKAVDTIIPVYKHLCEIENQAANSKLGLELSHAALAHFVASKEMNYDELVFAITL